MNLIPLRLWTMIALSGCAFQGSSDPQLLVPDDIEVPWDISFNAEDDGAVAMIPVDVMIYDPATGDPMAGADVEFMSGRSGAFLVSPDEVMTLDNDESGVQEGDLDAGWWDTWRDRYVAFEPASDGESADSVALTGRITMRTDVTGLARIYVVADAFPTRGINHFLPLPITVSMGETDDTFLLLPR